MEIKLMTIKGHYDHRKKVWKICMNRKVTLDIIIVLSGITGMALSYAYLEDIMERQISLAVFGIVAFFFFLLAVADRNRAAHMLSDRNGSDGISQLLLLSEDGSVTDTWDIYGKTSIVFGRDGGENMVDVDLRHTDYAGTVDREHAVMNYSGGSWYIEDLDSENGTRIRKQGADRPCRVSAREPCRVGKGDVIYLGLAPLKIQ